QNQARSLSRCFLLRDRQRLIVGGVIFLEAKISSLKGPFREISMRFIKSQLRTFWRRILGFGDGKRLRKIL
ncbi:hypothetical protein N9Y42_09900, partial [Mariniblastus sp.]|nr:hypothetical protein [Mariniblastus sp.]